MKAPTRYLVGLDTQDSGRIYRGIFNTLEAALAACTDPYHFYLPFEINHDYGDGAFNALQFEQVAIYPRESEQHEESERDRYLFELQGLIFQLTDIANGLMDGRGGHIKPTKPKNGKLRKLRLA